MKNRTLTLILCLTAYAFAGSSLFAQSQGPANVWTSGTNKGQFSNPLIVPANSGTGANQFANGNDSRIVAGQAASERLQGSGTLTVSLSGTAVTTDGSQTLSAKTLASPVFSGTATGTLTLNPDTDQTTILGRLRVAMRFGTADQISLSHFDQNSSSSTWGIVFPSSGEVYINAPTSSAGIFFYENSSTLISQFEASQARFIVGSASTPGITFIGDLDTGIYWSGANSIDFTTSGTRRGGFNSSGNFDTAGSATIVGNLSVGGGATVTAFRSATATLDFDLTSVVSQDLTITVTGAALGDTVAIGVPNGSVTADTIFYGWVSATDTVTIRATRVDGTPNPASGTFRATLIKF